MIKCQDPMFIGSAVYMKVHGRTERMREEIQDVREREDGQVDIDTTSKFYVADFSDDRHKQIFLNKVLDGST